MLRILGHPTRIEIILLLRHGPTSVSDIAIALECSQPDISKHLRILLNMGLVEGYIDGRWHFYKIINTQVGDFVAEMAGEPEQSNFLDSL